MLVTVISSLIYMPPLLRCEWTLCTWPRAGTHQIFMNEEPGLARIVTHYLDLIQTILL